MRSELYEVMAESQNLAENEVVAGNIELFTEVRGFLTSDIKLKN